MKPLSPFELIKQGVTGLINEGKSFFANDNSTAGIIKNTITGLPDAAKKMREGFFNRGYSDAELKPYDPGFKWEKGKVVAPEQTTFKEKAKVASKVGSEMVTGLGGLGAKAAPYIFPGYQNMIDQAVQTKTGGLLADIIPKLEKYQQPESAKEAAGMRTFDIATNIFPVGSTKNLAKTSKIIAASKDANVIGKELKGLGLADDVIEAYTPSLVEASDPKTVSKLINEAQIPEPLQQTAAELEFRKESLNNNYFKNISPKRYTKEGSLTELGDMTNTKMADRMQRDMAEARINDPTVFAEKLNEYRDKVKQLALDEKQFKTDVAQYRKGTVKESPTYYHGTKTTSPDISSPDFIVRDEKNAPYNSPGVSITSDKGTAGIYGKKVVELKLSPDAKIIKIEDAMKQGNFDMNTSDPSYLNDQEDKAIFWAKKNGYDGIDLRGAKSQFYRSQNEVRVFNKDVLKKPTLTSPLTSVATARTPIAPANLGAGEARSLERLAQQSVQDSGLTKGSVPYTFDEIIKQAPVDVKQKVGIIEAARTPENVYRMMGLSDEFNGIRAAHEGYIKELPENIDKITQWSKQVPKESNPRIFDYLDGQAVDLNPQELKVANEIKTWLASWADRLGLPKDNRITDYITHIFDDQLIKKEFDQDLAKIIADKIPGSVYNPFVQERLGALGYKRDAWAALDAYAKRSTRAVHMDPALDVMSTAAAKLEKTQYDYVKKHMDFINMRPTSLDTALDVTIKKLVGYRLGARPVARIGRLLRQVTFRGMIGGNLGAALKNLSQGVNTYAKLGEKYTIIGYAKAATKGTRELKELGVLADDFITDRSLSATKTAIQKLDKALFYFFDAAEKTNRSAAFYGAKAKALDQGKSLTEAIEFAKKIVRDTQFQYSSIDTPLALQGDLRKVITQFLTYPVKQTEFLAGMAKNKEYMGIFRYVLGALAVGYTVGETVGMEPTDFIPFYGNRLGVPPSLKVPAEVTKALIGTKDKYGQERTTEQKLKDVGNTIYGVIPAGIQIKNTLSGAKVLKEGGSFTDTGKKRFDAPEGLFEQSKALLFGQYKTKNGINYIDSGFKTKTVPKTEDQLRQEVKDKMTSGELGSSAVAKEYIVEELKKIKETEKNNRLSLPKEEFKAELKKLIVEKKLNAEDAAKEIKAYLKGDRPIEIKRGAGGLVGDYTKAFFTDPSNAWKGLVTKEQLGNVEGNLVQLQRFYGIKFDAKGGSEEKRKELMAKAGIPWSEKEKYNLEHIVPVSAGGDNSDKNLMIANRPLHDFYTPVDIALGNAVKSGKITRKEASALAIKLKVDKTMSAEDVINALK